MKEISNWHGGPNKTAFDNGYIDVRVRFPNRMIDKIEELRKEWGLKSRNDVVVRLFEEVLKED